MHSTMQQVLDPRTNQLLAALPDDIWRQWWPNLRAMDLSCGQALSQNNSTPAYAIFPTTAVLSLMCMTHDGATAEIGVVGSDGVVGLPLFSGGTGAPSQPVVQSAGRAYRLDAQLVTAEAHRGGAVLGILLRYGQVMLAQVAQTALCNRHHTIDQQFCRRLLVALDLSTGDELAMTQAGIALGLGVRREGVSSAAFKLQQTGAIRYSRGRIVVLDREQLEQQACECYRVARAERDRLLPATVRDSHELTPRSGRVRRTAVPQAVPRAVPLAVAP